LTTEELAKLVENDQLNKAKEEANDNDEHVTKKLQN
jgi:hypothetical protein